MKKEIKVAKWGTPKKYLEEEEEEEGKKKNFELNQIKFEKSQLWTIRVELNRNWIVEIVERSTFLTMNRKGAFWSDGVDFNTLLKLNAFKE